MTSGTYANDAVRLDANIAMARRIETLFRFDRPRRSSTNDAVPRRLT